MSDRPSAPHDAPSRFGDPQAPQVTRSQRFRDLAVGGALAIAFAAVAIALLPTRKDDDIVRGDELGRLQVRLTRDGETRSLAPADRLRAGDAVSFTYQGTEDGHLTVLGVDADGRVRVLHPTGERAAPWSPGTPESEPARLGIEPPPVLFAGVSCPDPVPVAEVQRALEVTASTPERFALLTCQIDLVRVGSGAP